MRQTGDFSAMQLVVRTALPPDSLGAGTRTALRPIDPNLPVRELVMFQDLVDRAASPRRFLVLLLAGFANFALILASLSIYAVISFSVSQRVREIGIRMALGASAADLQSRIVLRTLGLAALGLALGIAGYARVAIKLTWLNTPSRQASAATPRRPPSTPLWIHGTLVSTRLANARIRQRN